MDTDNPECKNGDKCSASVLKCKKLKKKIRATAQTTLQLFIAWILLIGFGSLIFIYIEQCVREHPKALSDLEIAWKRTCDMVRNNTTSTNGSRDMTTNNNGTVKNGSIDGMLLLVGELNVMCREDNLQIVEDDRRCVFDLENFADYVDYCYTIAFTIGFGHIVPYSTLGRVITMIYAIPAIGLTLSFYSYAAELLLLLTHIVSVEFDRKVRKRYTTDICKYKSSMIQISMAVILYVMMSLIAAFSFPEQMSVFEGFYFCFITVTTIGFGDIVYNSKVAMKKPLSYAMQMFFFLIGMATVASTISAVSEILQKKSLRKWLSAKRSIIKRSKNRGNSR